MLSHAIIFWFEAEWQIVMLSAAGFHIIMGITVYNLCEDEKNRGIDGKIFNPEITNDLKGTKRFIKFLLFVREVIRDNNNKLYLLAMALLKSILYGFLLWMPTFMKHKNWADFADYVPTIFNICTVGGSALLGYFYKDI
jgi:sugar phosphate permease